MSHLIEGSLKSMKTNHQFVEARASDECGCPEEDWVIGMLFVTIHLEPESGGHIFLDCGDFQDEKLVDCTGIEELRILAVDWVSSFKINNEL